MASKLSEAQDAFFQAFAAMPKRARVFFANSALDARFRATSTASEEAIELAVSELLALSDAIAEET